jgi:uncharacterized protein YbaR (Trm112 family)
VPISKEMLEILCCPVTRVPVGMLPDDELQLINERIKNGTVKDAEGNLVDQPLQEALITEDNKTVYRIDENIPVMLAESGIPTEQIEGF